MLLHCADISNPCKPWFLCKEWCDRCLSEFFHQGELEKSNNLTVSPNCDRFTTDQSQLSVNFIEFIISPSFVSLRQLLPETEIICKQLAENRSKWMEININNIKNSKRSDEEKLNEIQKWEKRTQSFYEFLLPSERKKGNFSNKSHYIYQSNSNSRRISHSNQERNRSEQIEANEMSN